MAHSENSEGNRPMSHNEMENFLSDAFDREFSDSENPHVQLQVPNSAFGRRIREFDLVNKGFTDIEPFLLSAFDLYQSQILEAVRQFDMIKTLSYFTAVFERSFQSDENSDPIFEKRTAHIPTIVKEIDRNTNMGEHFQRDVITHVKTKVDEVMLEGSGFTLSKIERLTVQIFKYEPLRGSGSISLPKILQKKRSIVNIRNSDEQCFKWAILSALHHDEVHAENRNKVTDVASYRRWADELNFNNIEFPMRLNKIEQFMEQNEGIAINVYYFDSKEKRICPLFLALKPIENKYIHLLMITESETFSNNELNVHAHFCWIKNLDSLVHMQTSKNTRRIYLCDRCLNHFSSPEKLGKHKVQCVNINQCAIEMPAPGTNFETFKNYKNELKVPFIIYADTESLLKPPETSIFNADCSTQAHQEHEVHSIGYYFKNENDESRSFYASHRGRNCVGWFMDELTSIAIYTFDFLENKKPMNILSKAEEEMFEKTTFCHICKKEFKNEQSNIRVRDHCHISGCYRGAAHQTCNLEYQIVRNIPVIMHNLSGYDSHFLIKKLATSKRVPGEVNIIPHNSEKYISFIKIMRGNGYADRLMKNGREIKFKFIDSLQFMSASLDHLASILPQQKKQILKSECIKSGYCSADMFALLNRKGVFPYEYIDSYEKLEERVLPSKKFFRSMLTDSDVTEEDYIHAQNVWKTFGIKTLGEYSDLYLKTDVLLLADIFENFRSTCHAAYSLDPAHYFGAAGLTFDAMLKYSGISIELFTDVDMLMFAERGIRGGVSQINKRYVKANNIYMGTEFEPTKESSYLLYLDGKDICYISIDNMRK